VHHDVALIMRHEKHHVVPGGSSSFVKQSGINLVDLDLGDLVSSTCGCALMKIMCLTL